MLKRTLGVARLLAEFPRGAALCLLALILAAAPLAAPEAKADEPAAAAGAEAGAEAAPDPRAATGGASTLEDILRRQRGEQVDDAFRRENVGEGAAGAPTSGQLGTLGGASDPELWRALRFNSADVTVSSRAPAAEVLVQDGGMSWLTLRNTFGVYGGYAMLGMASLLLLFYLTRGRIRIDSGFSGITIERFNSLERFGHWLLALSFIALGITGILTLFGREVLIPLMGKEAFASVAAGSKWVHNNIAWPFMISLVLVFVMWALRNIPNKHDVQWMLQGGGLFSKNVHPPARKFNAGQKVFFWLVILLGGSVSLSGLALLFPFEMPMFAKTFDVLNSLGIGPIFNGGEPLPVVMAPHEEMQYAQLWHTIVAFGMMVVIIAHMYIGSVGMEGAYDAMGSGQVDINWAKEHHNLWVEEVQEKQKAASPTASPTAPAE